MINFKPNFVEVRTFGSRVGSNYIGINGSGAVSFYSGFYRSNGISRFEKCLMLYDKDAELIGFQLGGKELGDGTFPLNHNPKNKTAWISAQNFFKLNPELILLKIKGKYVPEIVKDENRGDVFVIDLKNRIEVRKK
jgi:hypothetical protein